MLAALTAGHGHTGNSSQLSVINPTPTKFPALAAHTSHGARTHPTAPWYVTLRSSSLPTTACTLSRNQCALAHRHRAEQAGRLPVPRPPCLHTCKNDVFSHTGPHIHAIASPRCMCGSPSPTPTLACGHTAGRPSASIGRRIQSLTRLPGNVS